MSKTNMTGAEFLASLPAPLSRRGVNYANDVTLAKAIRAELASAVKAGALTEAKFSVRINHHASLTVEIVEWHGGAVFSDEYTNAVSAVAEQGIKLESNPAYAALVLRAIAAAKSVGPKVVRSICGRGGVATAGQWSLERLIKAADKAGGRELVHDKRRGWVVKEAA